MIKDVIANLMHDLRKFSESQTSQPHDLRPRLPRCPFLDSFRLVKGSQASDISQFRIFCGTFQDTDRAWGAKFPSNSFEPAGDRLSNLVGTVLLHEVETSDDDVVLIREA